jgi:hypothetical protein
MVLDTRYSLIGGPMRSAEPGLYHDGERIDYRWGEPNGDAVKRHQAKKAETAKLAAQTADDARKVAELRSLESEAAKLRQTTAAKAHIGKLEKQLSDLQSRGDKTPKPRKGIRFSQGGFRVFKPNGTAA